MEKVLITGGTGFLGSNIAKRLINENYEIYATYHTQKTYISN